MKPRSLVLLLALVLLGHWAGLTWLHAQMPDLQPLTPMVDPLFTRIVVPTRTLQTRQLPPKPKPAHRSRNTVSMIAAPDVATEPAPEQDQQEVPDQSQPGDSVAPAVAQAASAPDPAGVTEAPLSAASAAVASAPVSDDAIPAPEGWPPDTRLSYSLTGFYRGVIDGSARVQWQREQNRYQARIDLRMALVFGVSMISQGEVSDTGLLPSVYEEHFLGNVRRLRVDEGWVRFSDGSQMPAPLGLQDTASQFAELSQRFASGREALVIGTPVQVWLARPQGMALWTYDVVEEETLITDEFGSVKAFHLTPRPIANPGGQITAEIWFAPSLRYLPVRIRISLGDGNFVDLLVERIEQATQAR